MTTVRNGDSSSCTDGEYEDYDDSDTPETGMQREASIPLEGGVEYDTQSRSRRSSKRYTILLERTKSNVSTGSEGVGGDDDFFETTLMTHSPFQLSNHEKNQFTPSAISPFGFYRKSARSQTVSALELQSSSQRMQRKNDLDLLRPKQAVKKHNSVSIEVDSMVHSMDLDLLKTEMVNEYKRHCHDAKAAVDGDTAPHRAEEETKVICGCFI